MSPDPVPLPGHGVSAAWLATFSAHPNVVVLDGSWYLPGSGRSAKKEFERERIPGARFFDVDACCDPDSDLPHTIPTPEIFVRCAQGVGVSNDTTVIVYDGSGVNLSAPRVWWTFRYFGHDRIAVLDGGMQAWKAAGQTTESGEPFATLEAPQPYEPRVRPELIRNADDVLSAIGTGSAQVVDMRSTGRFEGTAPEPRPGLRGGRIPGSCNVPYTELVDPDSGLGLSGPALMDLLATRGIDPNAEIIGTCGSGTSACALAWSLARLGKEDVAIYDGSWAEWGSRSELPISTGPSQTMNRPAGQPDRSTSLPNNPGEPTA